LFQILASTFLSLLAIIISSLVYHCAFLSPLINLTVNITILIFYTAGLILLTWNMYGTLGHSCSKANWASDDGMMICRIYKALYSFTLFGWLAQIAQIVLDFRSRRAQVALGAYNKMVGGSSAQDMKLDNLNSDRSTHASSQDIPYGIADYDHSTRSLREGRSQGYSTGSHTDLGQESVRMEDFHYDRHVPQTSYANSGYGYGPQQ